MRRTASCKKLYPVTRCPEMRRRVSGRRQGQTLVFPLAESRPAAAECRYSPPGTGVTVRGEALGRYTTHSLVDAVPAVRGKPGFLQCCPDLLYVDRVYDRMALWIWGIAPASVHRNPKFCSGRGKCGWIVEWTLSCLHQFPPTVDPLLTPFRHPRGVPLPGLRNVLLATVQTWAPLVTHASTGFPEIQRHDVSTISHI